MEHNAPECIHKYIRGIHSGASYTYFKDPLSSLSSQTKNFTEFCMTFSFHCLFVILTWVPLVSGLVIMTFMMNN